MSAETRAGIHNLLWRAKDAVRRADFMLDQRVQQSEVICDLNDALATIDSLEVADALSETGGGI